MRMDTALDNVELALDLVRDDPYQAKTYLEWIILQTHLQFRIGPFIYTGIRSLGGSHSLGPSQSFDATWTVVPVAERRLVREAHYQAIITLSFASSGHSTLMRLNSPRLFVAPRASMKLLYFLPPPSAQGENTEAIVSIVNTGYRQLSGLRIEGAQFSVENAKKEAAPYSIDSVSLRDPSDHREIPRDEGLIGPIPSIPSGRSLQMAVRVAMRDKGKLRRISFTPSLKGAALRLEDTRSFTVLTKPGNGDEYGGMLVAPLEQSAPVFYFSPVDSKLQNVAGLKLIQSRWDASSTSGSDFIRVQAAMQSNESPDFASTLWGRVELPKIPANYKLLRVREVGAGVSPSGRGVGGETWIEKRDGKQYVNWIDSGAIPRGGSINYEFIFGDPKDFEQPIFAQDLYRIQVLPEFWPQPGTVVGQIRATSPIDKPLTYSLYSRNGDQTWAVNPNSGQIILAPPLRRGEEACLTMVVKDSDGRKSVVPVAVNTGGTAALPCPPIADFAHLTPLIWDPTLPTLPPTRPTPATVVPTRPTQATTATKAPPIFTASPSTGNLITATSLDPAWTWMTTGSTPPVTPDRPLTTIPLSTLAPPVTTGTTGTASGSTLDSSWTWMTSTSSSVTSDRPLITIPVVTLAPILSTLGTIGTIGTTPGTTEWVSAITLPTDGWEQPSTVTGEASTWTSSEVTSESSTVTSPMPSESSLTSTTTEETNHSHSPDTSLEPATTIIIPWMSNSPDPLWTSTIFPTAVPTDEWVEYTTEPASHPTHPTHIISPLPTLATVPATLGT
ncbi:hypothetical protein PENTCL1PPCAC_345, partial [Pristionchus entomophagus]